MQSHKVSSAIIVAAGKGERFSPVENKILLPLGGKRIFEYSLDMFQKSDFVQEIILVGPENMLDKDFKSKFTKLKNIVPGGAYRQQSVWNGLHVVDKNVSLVWIHDAARPFFSRNMLMEMLELIEEKDGIIPILPIYDAIKEKNSFDELKPHPSLNLFRTQTPQLYKKQILIDAYKRILDRKEIFRDEMEILASYQPNCKIGYVKGGYENEKITTYDEYILLKKMLPWIYKTGIGYDFHPFIEDKPLILGGIQIPFHLGLEGDSDGDVLCHSILDSILGSLSLGDIGNYMGIKTPQTINAKSLDFLKFLQEDRSLPEYRILHIDTTIVCKEPLLNPWIKNMVECLSNALHINVKQINIKSTTDKGFDAAGIGKGIRVISIATVEILEGSDEWQRN